MKGTIIVIFLFLFTNSILSQEIIEDPCAFDAFHKHQLLNNPKYKKDFENFERKILQFDDNLLSRDNKEYILPVVVHIIHNGGEENISNEDVLRGIDNLNEAYANKGYYDQNTGVKTGFQFCLAQQDPDGNPTTGINRVKSELTNVETNTEDLKLKNLIRWDPLHYINIWLVKDICVGQRCSVVGYAYFPSMHGRELDGLVVEAAYFAKTKASSSVQIHEMGHYLGLYHTFQGGCKNDNCKEDGDKVCDTPPDNSTFRVKCGDDFNSCSTDAQSGFNSDQNDMYWNYMDYGDFNCYSAFTEGQRKRMVFTIENFRNSLLDSKACISPCPTDITADFTTTKDTFTIGEIGTFINLSSSNASIFSWEKDGVEVSTNSNLNYEFRELGTFTFTLKVYNSSKTCYDYINKTIVVVCSAKAKIITNKIEVLSGELLNFNSLSTGIDSYKWLVDNSFKSSTQQINHTFFTEGIHTVTLIVRNNKWGCSDTTSINIIVTCPVESSFTTSDFFSSTNKSINFNNTSINATSYVWKIDNNIVSTNTNLQYTFSNSGEYKVCLEAKNGNCEKEFCSTIFVIDSSETDCDDVFVKRIGDTYIDENGQYIFKIKENEFIIAGSIGKKSAFIFIDNLGNVLKTKTVEFLPNSSSVYYLYMDNNGYLLGTGHNNYLNKMFAFKYDIPNNTILWIKTIGSNSTEAYRLSKIKQLETGNYIISGQILNKGCDAYISEIEENSGKNVWYKIFDSGSCEEFRCLELKDNSIYGSGRFAIHSSSESKFRSTVMKLDLKGNEKWTKYYLFSKNDYARNYIGSTIQDNGIVIAAHGNEKGSSINYNTFQIFKIDYNGNLIWKNSLNLYPYQHIRAKIIINLPDGYLIGGDFKYDYSNRIMFLSKFNKNGKLIWAKSYKTGINNELGSLIWNNGFFYITGTTKISGKNDIIFMKIDRNGNLPNTCSTEIKNLNIESKDLNNKVESVKMDKINLNLAFSLKTKNTKEIKLKENDICKIDCIDTCELVADAFLNILDSKCSLDSFILNFEICNYGNHTIPINTPVAFYKNNPLKYSTELLGIYNLPDSIITNECKYFSFKIQADNSDIVYGFVNEIGKNNTPIDTLVDLPNTGLAECNWSNNLSSFNLEYSHTKTLDLGADLSMCESGIVILDAGSGFESYLWHDGSTNSTFTAWGPGKYWVEVKDECGNIQSDTINVIIDTASTIDLGDDITVCKGETVKLNLIGFETYNWFPKNLITCDTCNSITFKPISDTKVSVIVTNDKGCYSTDTVNINLVKAKPINLGDDLIICHDVLISFELSGFKEYKWNKKDIFDCDDCNKVTYKPNFSNIISVEALDSNNCIATDSVYINIVDTNVSLGEDREICLGDSVSITLSGYEKYQWSPKEIFNCDSCNSISFTPNNDQIISVKVFDEYGCEASDEIEIKTHNPKVDLGEDIEICEGDSVQFSVSGFDSIQWKIGNEIMKTCKNDCNIILKPTTDNEISVFAYDNIGCLASDTTNYSVFYIENFRLPQDTIISLGDEIQITPIGIDDEYSYHWTPSKWLSCDNCYSTDASPLRETLYTLELTDSHGCTETDEILIKIKKDITIYIPNVFTPNGDGKNDIFYVEGKTKGIKEVNYFKIFDRWGELIYENSHFQINDPLFGWDGTFRGQKVNPRVFVYIAVIELIDDSKLLYSGDITVLR